MSKEMILDVNEDTINYLQRLGYEVDSMRSIIDFMFDSHRNDKTNDLFESVPWKTYMRKYEQVNAAYNMAKLEYSKQLQKVVDTKLGRKNVEFNWEIENFQDKKVRVTLA